MSQIIFSQKAILDIERFRIFLHTNGLSAIEAVKTIIDSIDNLAFNPRIGRPVKEFEHEHRELIINFGSSGYIAEYRIDKNIVTILALRHQKEVGY